MIQLAITEMDERTMVTTTMISLFDANKDGDRTAL
jgi:hypothetical protein